MSWSTPVSRDYKDGSYGQTEVPVNALLGRQAVQWARQFQGILSPEHWPTPDAGAINDGETVASWRKRKARLRRDYKNGNGMGTPLAMASVIWGETFRRLPETSPDGSPSPDPGPTFSPRLNPGFVLWLMGLPEFWLDL